VLSKCIVDMYAKAVHGMSAEDAVKWAEGCALLSDVAFIAPQDIFANDANGQPPRQLGYSL